MGVFKLYENGISADIVIERDCPEGVKRVAEVVADDIEALTGLRPRVLVTGGEEFSDSTLTENIIMVNSKPSPDTEGKREVYELVLSDCSKDDYLYYTFLGVRRILNIYGSDKRGLIYGASVTVTTENLKDVSSEQFIGKLSSKGCKAVIFVEFVPVTEDSQHLAPGDEERAYLAKEITRLRQEHPEMVFVSFPGDEKSSGGCIAAGRGFFHINSHGGAEPCPFSPYSDINVKETSLREAINSKLFKALQSEGVLLDDHAGGCVLYEKRKEVEALCQA